MRLDEVRRSLEQAVDEHLRHDDEPDLEDAHRAQWHILQAMKLLSETVEQLEKRVSTLAMACGYNERGTK